MFGVCGTVSNFETLIVKIGTAGKNMIYDELPIFKATLDFVVYIETIVKSFDKYHKYTIGEDLRTYAKEMLFLVHKANIAKENRLDFLERLRDKCEEMKMLLRVAKELKAFKSFNSFEHSSRLIVDICKQSQNWLRSSAGVFR
jgi:hypothetical protein